MLILDDETQSYRQQTSRIDENLIIVTQLVLYFTRHRRRRRRYSPNFQWLASQSDAIPWNLNLKIFGT